ncbi:hypothetical protein LMB49_10890 [Limosilactobacillus reuteri]|uniref:hypothetical protein n=1 Tax=Limosilactobacillus reuteri TaxID=1598 RepID=UPI001E5BAEDC|nr:hypothetical protein [Limosilactobacillus reuteri]MCC4371896.1 hypothetical protein [Limosilactobacillus reuteri]MCC4509631.1 hypothetical protein [Limosilactobacillus reuteri]
MNKDIAAKLSIQLKTIDDHLSIKRISKDDTIASLDGDFVSLEEQHDGDVRVMFNNEQLLSIHKVQGIWAIDLDISIFNKEAALVMSDVFKVCADVLPEEEE